LYETTEKVAGQLLDVVLRKSTAVLKLLSGESDTLLIRRNAFLVLDVVDHACGGLFGEFLENLHSTTTEAKNKMEGALLLDVVIRDNTPVLKLLSSKDQTLLFRRDTKGKKRLSHTTPPYLESLP
jgi:hypothetical protein